MFFTLCKSCDYLLKSGSLNCRARFLLLKKSRLLRVGLRFWQGNSGFHQSLVASKLKEPLIHFCRYYSSKRESYFSAIGGESEEPPPDLTPEQVTAILRKNEKIIVDNFKVIKSIECNQLASNHPVEDRLRVSRLHLDSEKETIALCVFDGHGGSACAHVISKRLFHYLALALVPHPSQKLNNGGISTLVEDLYTCPNSNHESSHAYDSRSLERIRVALNTQENGYLSTFASELGENPVVDVKDAIRRAFIRLDADLSREIESILTSRATSNALLHYYLSLAVSGCCVALILIHGKNGYVASTGDCRAVLGLRLLDSSSERPTIKCITLTNDHNSDNISEIKRLFAIHPPNEHNNIIRNNRLLGHLMPFRAFGDFCYKWPVDKIKRTGLIRAFGPHIIPPHYFTPPYLIPDPEVNEIDACQECITDKFVILATDGLWEQFESSRNVVKQVVKHNDKRQGREGPNARIVTVNNNVTEASGDYYDIRGLEMAEQVDENTATYLTRRALCISPTMPDPHVDRQQKLQEQHKRIVTFLTLPESVVRSFRDDISVIVTKFK